MQPPQIENIARIFISASSPKKYTIFSKFLRCPNRRFDLSRAHMLSINPVCHKVSRRKRRFFFLFIIKIVKRVTDGCIFDGKSPKFSQLSAGWVGCWKLKHVKFLTLHQQPHFFLATFMTIFGN